METFTPFDPLVYTTFYTYDYDKNYQVTENYGKGVNNKSMMYEAIFIVLIYSAICFLGIIGNGLVIWFGIFRMKKTVNVVFFLSLAIADFSFALFLPLNITQIILGYWPFEKLMCKLFHVLLSLNMLVSILQLTFISVDRCICVVFPVWCHNHRRPRLALIIVLIIWIISFLLAFSYLLISDLSDIITICYLTLDESNLMRRTVLDFVLFFFLPFVIIVFCYIMVALHLRKKRIFTSPKLFKTIVAVIIAFFVCWFPNHLFSLLFLFERSNLNIYVLYYGAVIAFALVITNSCINPILYVFIGRDFKENFCGSFQATLEKAFIEKEELDSQKQERHVALPALHQASEEEVVI
ncbi:chemokine-like receptor 1 [Bufo gargarizans]|uniref:chemokine-like receptor 1 n=1 Tax=Bufo gargarizans TaxID=30331 RepID=UPI001CF46FDD|nr:chemokine-like receptor 1 [Bufo gargarizans]